DPISGEITNADATRRRFTGATRRAIMARDRDCRGCGAPIRHLDHIQPHAAGGPTTIANGQGLCQRCNQVKEQPGWRTQPRIIQGRHVTVTTTPTGHAYISTPPLPVSEPPPRQVTSLEQHLRQRLEHTHPERDGPASYARCADGPLEARMIDCFVPPPGLSAV
uniref:HNH endonuclease n=1 Tax=Cumulibacter manganitolerans TaxID=1884992 RepID=UPI001885DA40